MKTFQITKKNRKYFAAVLEGKYPCKILVDEASDALTIGEHTLEVDDISVRSKYGTDLIFKLLASVEEQQKAGICTLRTDRYNARLTAACRDLGGKWDSDEKAWIFSGFLCDEVDALDAKYNSLPVTVEVAVMEDVSRRCAPVSFLGFTLARAYDRDSGAKLGDGVAHIRGCIGSGGSRVNWCTTVSEGSVFKMQIPEDLLGGVTGEIDGFSYRVIS